MDPKASKVSASDTEERPREIKRQDNSHNVHFFSKKHDTLSGANMFFMYIDLCLEWSE